jgi:predicted permease
MLDVLQIVLPVFILIAAGYGAVRSGFLSDLDVNGLMKIVQNIAIPSLLFMAMVRLDLSAVFKTQLLLSYYIGSLACFVLGIFGATLFFGRRPGEAVVLGFSAMFSNTVLLGLPIMERAYGPGSTEPNLAVIAIHVPFCYLLGITTMEMFRADGRAWHRTALVIVREIFSNPMVVGLFLGLAVNLISVTLPEAVKIALDMLARAALPGALFGLGGILTRYSLSQRLSEVAMVSAIRLFVHPGIALFLSDVVFDLSDALVRGVVITAAMAPGANAYIFANMYDRAIGSAASVVLIGTVASVFSVSFWLLVLGT